MGFAWLDKLATWVSEWFPWFTLIHRTQAGVIFKHGHTVKEIRDDNGWWLPTIVWLGWLPLPRLKQSGLHCYWPVWSHCEWTNVARQTQSVGPQTITLADGVSVIVTTHVVATVRNIQKFFIHSSDTWDALDDECQIVVKNTLIDCTQEDLAAVDIELTKALRQIARDYGVYVVRAAVVSWSTPRHSLQHWLEGGVIAAAPAETE